MKSNCSILMSSMHAFRLFYTPVFSQDEQADNPKNSRCPNPHNSGNDDVVVAFFPYKKTNRRSNFKPHILHTHYTYYAHIIFIKPDRSETTSHFTRTVIVVEDVLPPSNRAVHVISLWSSLWLGMNVRMDRTSQ